MVRPTFGATAADFLMTTGPGGSVRVSSGTLTMWSAETGGTQYTDLLLDGSPVTSIPVGSDGQVPLFQGPDGVSDVWADAGGSSRVRLIPDLAGALATTDTAVKTLVDNTASDTHAALNGLIAGNATVAGKQDASTLDADVATKVADRTSASRSKVDKAAREGVKLCHLDSFNNFFGGAAGKWVTGQGNTATTLTSAVSAGASVLPVASATGIVAGMQLVVAEGTAQQKIYTVASIAGTDVTINGTTAYALASGAAVTPLWTNSSHLTIAGYTALARFVARATDLFGNNVLKGTAPKVTMLGNSWISQGTTLWGAAIQALIPGATVVNAGVSGNKSADLLARFAADVPADSDYVIFNEPGVNDDTSAIDAATQDTNFQVLVSRIIALGAVPVYMGHVPLADVPGYSTARATKATVLLGDGTLGMAGMGPSHGTAYFPSTDSLALGPSAGSKTTTGANNTFLGVRAGAAVTTGGANTFVGREAGTAATTGSSNTGVGQNALRGQTTGSANTALGSGALAVQTTAASATGIGANAGLLNTANSNLFIGANAGYSPLAVSANATTTSQKQTVIGTEAGQGDVSANNHDDITVIGYRATAGSYSSTVIGSGAKVGVGAHDSLAIGKGTQANGTGSVALGTDNGGTGATATATNEFALGTALHQVKISNNTTGAGSAALGANSPATTNTAPYTWFKMKSSDGSTVYVPAWK